MRKRKKGEEEAVKRGEKKRWDLQSAPNDSDGRLIRVHRVASNGMEAPSPKGSLPLIFITNRVIDAYRIESE